MIPLQGKTALITGASRRIGRATALALADVGMGIIAHFLGSEREARALQQNLLAREKSCWLIRADLEKEDEVESLLERAGGEAGRPIDVLINNASIFPTDTLSSISLPTLNRCLAINAWAPLVLCRSFARQTRQGHVVNLLDEGNEGYRFTHVSYQISKLALALVTRMAALELAPGIAVNAVAPGLVLPPPGEDGAWLEEQARAKVPLARPGSPEDVADAIVFLVASRYLTGQTIYVDGGKHLMEPTDGPHPH